MVNKWLIDIKRSLQTESRAGGAHVVSTQVPEERRAGIVGRSRSRPGRRQGMAPARRHSFSAAHADQNVQPSAVSEAFVASRVCLQVASMVAFADGFLAKSTHALRV